MEQADFVIDYASFPRGNHQFTFHVGESLFSQIEGSLLTDGDLTATVNLSKSELMMRLSFHVEGTVKATCDVCLGEFDYPVEDCGGEIVIKFGDHYEDVNDELYIVDEADGVVNVAQWIYEFICVSLPIRFEHPIDADGNSTCDPDMLARLDQYLVKEKKDDDGLEPDQDGKPRQTDPRWDALKSLLNK